MWALMQSLNMLVCTEGRERNVSEYEFLLNQPGSPKSRAAGRPDHWSGAGHQEGAR